MTTIHRILCVCCLLFPLLSSTMHADNLRVTTVVYNPETAVLDIGLHNDGRAIITAYTLDIHVMCKAKQVAHFGYSTDLLPLMVSRSQTSGFAGTAGALTAQGDGGEVLAWKDPSGSGCDVPYTFTVNPTAFITEQGNVEGTNANDKAVLGADRAALRSSENLVTATFKKYAGGSDPKLRLSQIRQELVAARVEAIATPTSSPQVVNVLTGVIDQLSQITNDRRRRASISGIRHACDAAKPYLQQFQVKMPSFYPRFPLRFRGN